MVRITVDGDQVQFSSKLDVHPDNWDTKLGRAVVNKQSAEKKENLRVSSLNKTLDEIRAAITMHYTRMMNTDGYALPEKIRNAFLGLEEKEKTLISYFTQHNEQYAKKVGKTATQKTYSRYELTKQRMIEFLKSEYNISDIPIKEITVTHIENFYLYLREQCEVSNNTAMKFVQRFHTILLFAQKSGLSFLDPFNNFRFNFDKTDRGYLTQEEIDTIYHKEFQSKRLEQVRDAFIFSCYTGLPYCDIYTLTAEDIKIGVDGKKWIMKDRGKTGVESLIPLLPIPLEILAKYEGKTKKRQTSASHQQPENERIFGRDSSYLSDKQADNLSSCKTYQFFLLIENKKLTKVVSLTGNDLETSGLLYSAMFCTNQKNAFLICKSSVFIPYYQSYSSEK